MSDAVAGNPWSLTVKALIYDEDDRCLAIRRSQRSGNWPGMWDLPGGKLDTGERFDHALLREVREETGLQVVLTALAGSFVFDMPEVRVVHLIMRARVSPDSGPLQLGPEHDLHRWVHPLQLAELQLCDPIAMLVRRSQGS